MVENNKMNIAVLGGSFDPPTISHLQIVCEVYNTFEEIHEVWIVPCGDERMDKTFIANSQHRLNMIELLKKDLISDTIPIKIIDIETKNHFIPTYELYKILKTKYNEYNFEFIFGSNILNEYLTWENGLQLKNECKFIILERPGISIHPSNFPENYRKIPISIDLGDKIIRDRIIKYNNTKKKNFAINGLTSKSVIKYIKENNLYLQQDE